MFDGPSEFSRILYYHIIGSGREKDTPTVEMIADSMGLKPVTIYKKLEGESPVSVEEFIRMFRFTGRHLLEALKYVVRECDSRFAVIDIVETTEIDGSFQDEKDGIAVTIGELTSHLMKSLEDGNFDRKEKARARDILMELQNLITRFINEVEHYGE